MQGGLPEANPAGLPVEVKKTDLTISGATLESDADPTYDFNGGGAGGSGYGIVLAGYESGTTHSRSRQEMDTNSLSTTGRTTMYRQIDRPSSCCVWSAEVVNDSSVEYS